MGSELDLLAAVWLRFLAGSELDLVAAVCLKLLVGCGSEVLVEVVLDEGTGMAGART